jgi:hypothetical protein
MGGGTWKRALARLAAGIVVALVLPAVVAPRAEAATIYVHDAAQFQAAVRATAATGGRIVLLRHSYTRQLVVGPRSGGYLTVVGTDGVRVRSIMLDHTRWVTLKHLTLRPAGGGAAFPHQRPGDAGVLSLESRHILLSRLDLSAIRTTHKVTVDLDHSSYVEVTRSTFSHCGDEDPDWSLCLLPRYADHVTILRNNFHDCRGCDFIHGRFGPNGVIRENRFMRALVCHHTWVKCGHQDLVELFLANGLLVSRNVFGVSQRGGAQLYFANFCDHVRVVSNLFLRTDPRAPGVVPRAGVLVGTRRGPRFPYDVTVINNTVLSGRLVSGLRTASSIVLSPHYTQLPLRLRPLVANNIIARLTDPSIVCTQARASISNVVIVGSACSGSDVVGDPLLSADFRPTAGSSLLIGRADAELAPQIDLSGARRDAQPDIGCYEYMP